MAIPRSVLRTWIPSRRLVAAFLVLGLLPLATLTYSSLRLSQHAVQREVDHRVDSVAASSAAYVSRQLDSITRSVTVWSSDTAIRDGLSHPVTGRSEMLREILLLLDARPELRAAAVTDANGRLVQLSPADVGIEVGTDLRSSRWFPEVAGSSGTILSEAFASRGTGNPRIVVVASAIHASDLPGAPVIGYLAVSYSLPIIQAVVNQLADNQGMTLTVTDSRGTVVARPGLNATDLRSMAADDRIAAARVGLTGTETVGAGDQQVLSAYRPVDNTGWTVLTEVPAKAAFAGVRQLRIAVLAIAGLLAVILLFVLSLIARLDARRREVGQQLAARGRALADSEARFRVAFLRAPVAMARLDSAARIVEANHAFFDLLGRSRSDLIGRPLADLMPSELPLDSILGAQLASLEPSDGLSALASNGVEVQYRHGSGELVWALVSATRLHDADGTEYTLIQSVDIDDRKAAELSLNRRALHDPLTGLPNRVLLDERIDHALERLSRNEPGQVAVLFIDLDGFKAVNDEFGHRAGDDVLREIAARIDHVVRPGDTVARLGGDEFVVLCEDLPVDGEDIAADVARRIIAVVSEPGRWTDRVWQIGASIGIARPNSGEANAAGLVAEADAAMYRAKQSGKGRFEVYDPTMAIARADSAAIDLLDRALDERRLRLVYQPVVELATGRVLGAEALLRMVGDDGQLLPPADFLPAAEAHGHIVSFGEWTLREACEQAVRWRAEPGAADFTMAVNASVKEIEDSGFLGRVDLALALSGLPASALTIELTESAFLRDLPTGRAALRGLAERGVRLALDDFGTGFSSLSYLRRFPVDVIKIDRSFIADLLGGPNEALVTEGLIALAHTMQTVLIAEGVEQPRQTERLLDLGCQTAQGFLLGRPLPASELDELIGRPPVAPAREVSVLS